MSYFGGGDLERYLACQRLSVDARHYIEQASLGPSRNVGRGTYPAISGEYQSEKMGVCVNAESSLEIAYAILLDFDDNVVAYYEQPPAVDCMRTSINGTRRLQTYTPDFLVLEKAGARVIEIKPAEVVARKLATATTQWVKREGDIIDIPAEQAFLRMGMIHRVISSASLDATLVSNCKLLMQAKKQPDPPVALIEACSVVLNRLSVCSLAQLAEAVRAVEISPLLKLIALKEIHVDLSAALLSMPESCLVSLNPSALTTEVRAAWQSLLAPQDALCATSDRVQFPLGKHLQRALDALDALRSGKTGRTQRRWASKARQAKLQGDSELLALAPRYHRSGNRNPGRPEIVLAYCENVIRQQWASNSQPTVAALYRIYRASAREWHPGLSPVCRHTYRRILELMKPALARMRGGKRLSNALQPPTPVADRNPVASRPFQLASADHYLCDIHCVLMQANGVKYAQRPWLTVLRDCATDAVLAVWISFRAPSRRSCALVIRQCLRQHGRLPEAIIVDRGSDFRSLFFSTLLAHCGIDLRFRPSGFPKYGSEAERYFHQFKNLWLSARPGNCGSIQEVRAISGSHRPEKYACMTLSQFYEEVKSFNEWINQYCAGSKTTCPATLLASGLQRIGLSGRVIAYDMEFVIATSVDEVDYRLDPQRGLHIGHNFFFHPLLNRLSGSKARKITVRRDPEDPYQCYAYLDGQWVTCIASRSTYNRALDPVQRMVEAILECDGDEARKVAKEDAEIDLIHRVWESEGALQIDKSAKSSRREAPLSPSASDVSDPFRSTENEPLPAILTERW